MNWQTLITDLCAYGLTQAEIAEKVGLKQPTISNLKTGALTSIAWEAGQAIVKLHKRHCPPSKLAARAA